MKGLLTVLFMPSIILPTKPFTRSLHWVKGLAEHYGIGLIMGRYIDLAVEFFLSVVTILKLHLTQTKQNKNKRELKYNGRNGRRDEN